MFTSPVSPPKFLCPNSLPQFLSPIPRRKSSLRVLSPVPLTCASRQLLLLFLCAPFPHRPDFTLHAFLPRALLEPRVN